MRRSIWGAVVGLALLGGCAAPVELADGTAAELQESVLAVTEAAAAGRYDVAAAELDAVRARLEAGVDAGDVSASRYRQIDEALDATSAELTAALEAQRAAEQAAAEQAAAEQAAAEQAAAEQAAAEQAAAEQAAAEQAAAERAEREEKGPGEDKGGGKGKGKDDD